MNCQPGHFELEADVIRLQRIIQNVRATWEDYWFDLRHDFKIEEKSKIKYPPPHVEVRIRNSNHRPTRAVAFRKLMTHIKFPAESVFVDYGCGKGRVLILALKCGFRKVVGIELSEEFCTTASRNLFTFQELEGRNINYEVIAKSPSDYKVREDENVFCLLAPLALTTLEKVLGNIERSQAEHSRDIWLICGHPSYQELLEKKPGIKRVSHFSYANSRFVVYASLRGKGRVKCTSPLGRFDDDL